MSGLDLWSAWGNLASLWWTRHGGVPASGLAQHRLEQLVAHARSHSPFYRERYADLPRERVTLGQLPAVGKPELMARFDRWCTDRRVRLREVRAFIADTERIGTRFLGEYWAWRSSGSSGAAGIFVQDSHAMAVYDALVTAQLEELPWTGAARALAGGGRAGLVVATGGHFAAIASWERMRRAFPHTPARSFSILEPIERLVADLNAFRPAFLAGYASVLSILAAEQRAGRLAIEPALAWSGGERLSAAARREIETAFGCTLANEYGASECLSIAHECRAGWQHLHSEWVLLEGIEADGTPTPPGRLSHDTLLTNLANWLQPVIRYRVGDRIVAAEGRCPCGSPRPAFRVDGRDERALVLDGGGAAPVQLAPLAIETVVEAAAGAHAFQVAQVSPTRLALRFEGVAPRAPLRRNAAHALRRWLATQALERVEVVQDEAAPLRDRRSGKLPSVVVDFAAARPRHRPLMRIKPGDGPAATMRA